MRSSARSIIKQNVMLQVLVIKLQVSALFRQIIANQNRAFSPPNTASEVIPEQSVTAYEVLSNQYV